MLDEAWLRERGYRLVGDRAIRRPRQGSSAQGEAEGDALPEAALLAKVRRCAREQGYLTYHTYSSRKSEEGYPDLTLVRPGRLIFAELKSTRGKVTREQHLWLDMLQRSVPQVEVEIWRPSDYEKIVQTLTRR